MPVYRFIMMSTSLSRLDKLAQPRGATGDPLLGTSSPLVEEVDETVHVGPLLPPWPR